MKPEPKPKDKLKDDDHPFFEDITDDDISEFEDIDMQDEIELYND